MCAEHALDDVREEELRLEVEVLRDEVRVAHEVVGPASVALVWQEAVGGGVVPFAPGLPRIR